MARCWVGRMWLLVVCNGLASSVDSRLWSAGMFKNEYWFRVVSVPGMHETSGFRYRSRCQDLNCMTTAVKWRHSAPTASEDDEKANTIEDEKTSAGLTRRAFEQDLSPTSNNDHYVRSASTGAIGISSPNYNAYVRERVYRRDLSVSCRASFDFFVTSPMRGNIHRQDDFIFRHVYSLF